MIPMLLDLAKWSTIFMAAYFTLTLFPRTHTKVMAAIGAVLPAWMLPIFVACLAIPGPFDEAAMIVVALVMCAVQPIRVKRATAAWHGGKSHRAWDLAVAS